MKGRAAPAPVAAQAPAAHHEQDHVLVDRAREGDAAAREELVRRHLPDVYRVTRRILSDAEAAQDAAQDAFVNALGALARFRGESSFRTWLMRIAVNAARSAGRRQGRRREVDLAVVENRPAEDDDPARLAVIRTESDRVRQLLDTLPPKQRMAVALRTQHGMSYAEIGSVIDCSEGAARVNYHLGIKRLRELAK